MKTHGIEARREYRNQTCGDRGCETSHQFCAYCENCMHHDRSSGLTHEECADAYLKQQQIVSGLPKGSGPQKQGESKK